MITGLTNVAVWLFYNRNRNKTEYAFVPAPSTYRTLEADTILVENTSLTQLYAKSSTADVVELEVWELEKEAS